MIWGNNVGMAHGLWDMIFLAVMSLCWFRMNKFLHEEGLVLPQNMVAVVLNQVHEEIKAKQLLTTGKQRMPVKWVSPDIGWIEVNGDGASAPNSCKAAVGWRFLN